VNVLATVAKRRLYFDELKYFIINYCSNLCVYSRINGSQQR